MCVCVFECVGVNVSVCVFECVCVCARECECVGGGVNVIVSA